MRLESPQHFATAIRAVEEELRVRYPPSAAALFAELAAILGTGHPHGLFKEAHLLITAAEVAAMRNELGRPLYDGYLLPFLSDGQREFPDVYGFDLGDPARDRIAVYAVHTIVQDWPTPAAFLDWVDRFVPAGGLAETGKTLSELDHAVEKFASRLLRRGFVRTGNREDAGYGYAERVYALGHVILKAVYERGLTYFEVGCASQPAQTIEASRFRDLLDPPSQGHWNLGMAEAEFLDEHWDEVYQAVSASNWCDTLQRLKSRDVADQSLDELEGVEWGPPTYGSSLVTNAHRLRRVPLKRYRVEDLRLMIGQRIGLRYLVPRALDHLEADPLASGDFYPGDLLASVARLPDTFWTTHRHLVPRAIRAIDGALARVHEVDTAEELPDELRTARQRLIGLRVP